MRDLLNAMSMRAALQSATRVARLHGIVKSYDPNTYSVKVSLQPSNTMTGWIPILTGAIGQGYGVAYGPQVGDQAIVDFADGDVESAQVTGFIFSDSDRPPPVPSGELWTVQKSGSFLKMHNDGSIEYNAANGHHFSGSNVQIDKALNVTLGITSQADIQDNTGTQTRTMAQMRQIYDSHTHPVPNVQSGSSTATTTAPTQQE